MPFRELQAVVVSLLKAVSCFDRIVELDMSQNLIKQNRIRDRRAKKTNT